MSAVRRKPGRPRSNAADRAILDAAFRLLREQGYDAMTMEAVAVAAGVAKTTVYRRYDDKADVVSAALAAHAPMPAVPATGDVRDDLIELVTLFQHGVIGGMGVTVVGTLMVQEERHPELTALFRRRVTAPRRQVMRQVLEEGIGAGRLRPDLDVEATIDLLTGGVLMRRMALGSVPDGFGRQVVDALWPAMVEGGG